MRGLALWFIFIDHAGNNPLERVTLGRFALCDAAEVFVLLSGVSSGLAYGGAFDRKGWLQAARSALRRAGGSMPPIWASFLPSRSWSGCST